MLTAEQLTGFIFQQNFTELEEMPWFRAIEEFGDAENISESKRDDDHDKEVLPRVIEKTVLPKITAFVKSVWDPLSTSQTKNLVQLCNNIFGKQILAKNESSRAREVKAVIPRKGNFTHCVLLCVLLWALRTFS